MKALDRVLQRWRIRKAIAYIAPGVAVLDIGCADGELFRILSNHGDSVGIDPDPKNPFPSLPRVRFYTGYFPEALLAGSAFDAITMLAVLEHVPADRLQALAGNCAAFLKPGGRLIITVPSPAVDYVLAVLKGLRVIDGMSVEQHYGFEAGSTPDIFRPHGFALLAHKSFQLGLNNLYVFERRSV